VNFEGIEEPFAKAELLICILAEAVAANPIRDNAAASKIGDFLLFDMEASEQTS
jgi:hypothetical protein